MCSAVFRLWHGYLAQIHSVPEEKRKQREEKFKNTVWSEKMVLKNVRQLVSLNESKHFARGQEKTCHKGILGTHQTLSISRSTTNNHQLIGVLSMGINKTYSHLA